MRFTKMQGCGNDYVYVDCFAQKPPANAPAVARKISDRHFGVGSDGLILIARSEKADERMIMFNADGSESEMCGNGIRCVAKYIYDHGIALKPTLTIEMVMRPEVMETKTAVNKADMGEPILKPRRFRRRCRAIQLTLRLDRVSDVRVGGQSALRHPCGLSPHHKMISDHRSRSLLFRKTNVEFVVNRPDDLTIWERGLARRWHAAPSAVCGRRSGGAVRT